MTDTSQPAVQPRASTPEGMAIEQFSRALLASIIDQSVATKIEYGGVIFRRSHSKTLGATLAMGFSPTGVDIGVWHKNRGCPENTTPVAWYHTHPTVSVVTLDFGVVETAWQEFIGGDSLISDSFQLPGYVGTMDRRFWRYDPPPGIIEYGKPQPKGVYGVLNGLLVPRKLPAGADVIAPLP